jgi:Nucleotidyltransferase/DNA polymerase involved in DNA repair
MESTYMCIDLKSYYASVECVERGLDPLTTNLVVSDESRTDRTICLAVSPSLKKQGVPGRPRLYEVRQKVAEINRKRLEKAPRRRFTGKSADALLLDANPGLELDFIIAVPQMTHYMACSAKVYGILLKFVAKEDIHVYSIDESFLDITRYMGARRQSPEQFARMVMEEILKETGITSTVGIGTNMYLAKIAMDIIAKHTAERIAVLTEERYREMLWDHLPLTDFWSINRGTVNRLSRLGLQTMRDVAHANEKYLYKAFGVNARFLIDHAWGRESTSMKDIKAYRPKEQSLSSGQVLHTGYDIPGAKLLILEMAELLSLELTDRGLSTDSVTVTLAYSFSSDHRPARGSISLDAPTSSTRKLLEYTAALYDRVAAEDIPVYHVGVCFNRVRDEKCWQYDLFSAPERQERERSLQQTIVNIKKKYGRNGIFKGMNLLEGGKTLERNAQVGGHRAG